MKQLAVGFAILVALVASSGVHGTAAILDGTNCQRVVAIGDLHGGYDAFVGLLQRNRLVDADLNWADGGACLVQLGDIVDRGAGSRDIMDLLIKLQQNSPERVFSLLGNHEVMNIVGDLRYVAPGEFSAFAADEVPEQRKKGFRAFKRTALAEQLSDEKQLAHFDATYPPGWFAHREAFSPKGAYGQWLMRRPIGLVLGRTFFVHGGISESDASVGVDKLNRRAQSDLGDYFRFRRVLEQQRWVGDLESFREATRGVEARLAGLERAVAVEPRVLRSAEGLVRFSYESPVVRADGPLWIRDLALDNEATSQGKVDRITELLDVDRIVVGHSTTEDGKIDSRFDGRVFVTDTGAGPAYDGQPSALEIRDEIILARYPDGEEVLWEKPWDDASIEKFLAEAEIREVKLLGTGITKPKKAQLVMDGVEHKAAFKYQHTFERGFTTFDKGEPVLNFTDSWKYERAAYLMDRLLGLGMTPPAVKRVVDGDEGALVWWVDGVVGISEKYEGRLTPPDPDAFAKQEDLMRLFDALILNTDRNLGNMLIRTRDFKLFLIDHTRTFRYEKDLTHDFITRPARLTRDIYGKLQALEAKPLQQLLKGMVNKHQIKAMLNRRDQILEKIKADCEEYGEAYVLDGEGGTKAEKS